MNLNHSKIIAVVDDDVEMRTMIKDFLVSQGYQVEVFPSAAGVMRALNLEPGHQNGRRFTALISDIRMGGGMDGMELLKSIKEQHASLPVLLITAYGTKEQETLAREAGAFDFLTKPFPLSRLANALERALGKVPC